MFGALFDLVKAHRLASNLKQGDSATLRQLESIDHPYAKMLAGNFRHCTRQEEKERVVSGQATVDQIVSQRLSGLSGGHYHKMETPPNKGPLYTAIRESLADFGEAALPSIPGNLQRTIRMGDYHDSTSFYDIEMAMNIVKEAGLGSAMAKVYVNIISKQSWSPETMVAVETLLDKQFVAPLIVYLLTKASSRGDYFGRHCAPNENVGKYCEDVLAKIAHAQQSSLGSVYIDYFAGIGESLQYWHYDSQGTARLLKQVVESIKAEPILNDLQRKAFTNLIGSGVVSLGQLEVFKSEFSARHRNAPSKITADLMTLCIELELREGLPDLSKFNTLRGELSNLGGLSARAAALSKMLNDLELQIKKYPEFEASAQVRNFYAQAYKFFREGKGLRLRYVPEQKDRVFEVVVSNAADPEAARDMQYTGEGKRYIRHVPVMKILAKARLELEAHP